MVQGQYFINVKCQTPFSNSGKCIVKSAVGDSWEGKRTCILICMLLW